MDNVKFVWMAIKTLYGFLFKRNNIQKENTIGCPYKASFDQ